MEQAPRQVNLSPELFEMFEQSDKPQAPRRGPVVVLAVVTLVVIAWLDYLTGPTISIAPFYLVPVAVIAWRMTMPVARIAALAAGVMQLTADLLARTPNSPLALTWNALSVVLLALAVVEAVRWMKRALEHEHDLARTDSLTGLPNSRSFGELAISELERSRRYGRPFTLVFMDLDHFKDVNDTFGHDVGDMLLHDIGQALLFGLRRVDIVARLGGDEFAALLPETDEFAALVAVAHVRDAIHSLAGAYGSDVRASFGSVTFTTPPASIEEMCRLADEAMYRAKSAGRDRVEALSQTARLTRLASVS